MSHYLILERSDKDIIYKDDYLIHLGSVKDIPLFIKRFLKRNKIKLCGTLDLSELSQIQALHKRRRDVRQAR